MTRLNGLAALAVVCALSNCAAFAQQSANGQKANAQPAQNTNVQSAQSTNVQIAQQQTEQTKLEKSQQVAPDNTSKNRRDKVADSMTAEKSALNKNDRELTQSIRKSIMASKGLSVNAQNVKIITKNGEVTLRGPVDNDNEKATLEDIVKGCGVSAFTNQVEVKGHNSQR